jgi:hypothetical protein
MMNEFYWAVMGIAGLLDIDDEALTVRWLTKAGEMAVVEIDHPSVKLFDTEEEAKTFIRKFLDRQNSYPRKIHKDFIYV